MQKATVGVSMLYCLGEPFETMLKKIPEHKTKSIEIVDDGLHVLDEDRVGMLNNIGRSHGLELTVHAPFAGVNIAVPSKPLLKAALKRLKESILFSAELDSRLWVFHPGMHTGISPFYPGEDWKKNIESIKMLFRFAKENGVNAVLENVMTPFVLTSVEDFRRFYDEIDEPIGLALDMGHANIIGELQRFLRELSDKLMHVHVHDNFGESDQHLGIDCGNIDWKNTVNLLKKASYKNVLVIESIEHVSESVQKLKQLLS